MKLVAVVLVVAISLVGVQGFGEEIANVIFKKYAMLKIFEDCYGKPAVSSMFSEIKQAIGKCQGQSAQPVKLSFVPAALTAPAAAANAPIKSAETKLPTQHQHQDEVKPNGQDVKPIMIHVPVVHQQQPSSHAQKYFPAFPYAAYPFNRYGYRPMPQQQLPYDYYDYPYAMMPFNQPYRQKRQQDAQHKELSPPDEEKQAEKQTMPINNKPAAVYSGGMPFEKLAMSYLANSYQGEIGLVVCVMKEIGFIGEDMQPNYEGIHSRIDNLPVSDSVKQDLCDGVEKCKKIVDCVGVPSSLKDVPMIGELAKPLGFFKCFKTKKIEACMKKDLREKLGGLLGKMDASMESTARRAVGDARRSAGYPDQENTDSIFNMIYGFDLEPESDDLF